MGKGEIRQHLGLYLQRISFPNQSDAFDYYFRNYLIKEFKLIKETKSSPDKIYIEFNKLDLTNGVTHEYRLYEGGTTTITSFPAKTFTMQEVFLLSRIIYPEFFTQKNCDYKPDHVECSLDDMSSLDIKKEGSTIVMMFGVAD